ncbi:hypothetical protein QTH91_13725 [Variovorax dokdonensis]|uniref:Secreted protein n=1 Tax=Variovorax dokdonensis TaxID=344883 RepID=A0ABT7NCA0_9BURK|nr:hypothetical protein [Variovorax dokdonensis]MDM0045547.1 hypothetical protein [Variovorax dokdonensis]
MINWAIPFLLLLLSFSSIAQPYSQEIQTPNEFSLTATQNRGVLTARIYMKSNGESILVSTLTKANNETPFANYALIDIENDGTPEVEFTGACDKACYHEIYKYSNGSYRLAFKRWYSEITVENGYYLVSERGGCCTEEIHIFSTPLHMNSKPLLTIEKERSNEGIRCTRNQEALEPKLDEISALVCSR